MYTHIYIYKIINFSESDNNKFSIIHYELKTTINKYNYTN